METCNTWFPVAQNSCKQQDQDELIVDSKSQCKHDCPKMRSYSEVALVHCMTFDFYEYAQYDMYNKPHNSKKVWGFFSENTLYRRTFTQYTDVLQLVDWRERLQKVRNGDPGFGMIDLTLMTNVLSQLVKQSSSQKPMEGRFDNIWNKQMKKLLDKSVKDHDVDIPRFRDTILPYHHCNHHPGITDEWLCVDNGNGETPTLHADFFERIFSLNSDTKLKIPTKEEMDEYDAKDGDQQSENYEKWMILHEKPYILCLSCHLELVCFSFEIMSEILNHVKPYFIKFETITDKIKSRSRDCNYKKSFAMRNQIVFDYLNNKKTLYQIDYLRDLFKFKLLVMFILKNEWFFTDFFDFLLIVMNFIWTTKYVRLCSCDNYPIAIQSFFGIKDIEHWMVNMSAYFTQQNWDYLTNKNNINQSRLSILDLVTDSVKHLKLLILIKAFDNVTTCVYDLCKIAQLIRYCNTKYPSSINIDKSNCNYNHLSDVYWDSQVRAMIYLLLSKPNNNTLLKLLEKHPTKHMGFVVTSTHAFKRIWILMDCILNWKTFGIIKWRNYIARFCCDQICSISCFSPQCDAKKYVPDYDNYNVSAAAFKKIKTSLSEYGITFCGFGNNIVKTILSTYLPIKNRLLITKKFYKCKRCNLAVYCSRKCQKLDWNRYGHGWRCKQFQIIAQSDDDDNDNLNSTQ